MIIPLCYAGIGNRDIPESAGPLIMRVAAQMAKEGFVLYSGNATGSDQIFQRGSGGKCVIWLPWKEFEAASYPVVVGGNSPTAIDVSFSSMNDELAVRSIAEYNPRPQGSDGRRYMARNWCQVMGGTAQGGRWPAAKLVICYAREAHGAVLGGTGQACRIAAQKGVPVVNLWRPQWKNELRRVVDEIKRRASVA